MFEVEIPRKASSAVMAREPAQPRLASGRVVRVDGGRVWVRTGGALRAAARAASCLLDPAEDDRVLTGTLGDGSCFVLAVLERAGEAPARLSVEGDLSLRAPSGKVEVVARDGVALVSPGEVQVTSGSVAIHAGEGRIGIDRLTVLGRELLAEVPVVKAIADTVDTVFDRLSQRVKRAYRTVEELDRLRAKRVDYRAEKTMCLSAEDAVVAASGVAKVDGEHIHLG